MPEILKHVTPEYQQQLDSLAETLRAERAAELAPALTIVAVQLRLHLVETPRKDAGWE